MSSSQPLPPLFDNIPESNYRISPPLWYEKIEDATDEAAAQSAKKKEIPFAIRLPSDNAAPQPQAAADVIQQQRSLAEKYMSNVIPVCTVEEYWAKKAANAGNAVPAATQATAVAAASASAAVSIPAPARVQQQAEVPEQKIHWSRLWVNTLRTSCFQYAVGAGAGLGLTTATVSFVRRRNILRSLDWMLYGFGGGFVTTFGACRYFQSKHRLQMKEIYKAQNL